MLKKVFFIIALSLVIGLIVYKLDAPLSYQPVADNSQQAAMPPRSAHAPAQVAAPGSEDDAAGENMNAHEFYDPSTARVAPDFALLDSAGKTVRLSDFKGKVVAVNFWATWCPPCLEEVPSLERLTKRAAAADLVVLAVSVDKSFTDIQKTLPGTTLRVLLDPDMRTSQAYGTVKFPETWILNREGKIVARFIGARNWDSALFEQFFAMLQKGEALPMTGR